MITKYNPKKIKRYHCGICGKMSNTITELCLGCSASLKDRGITND